MRYRRQSQRYAKVFTGRSSSMVANQWWTERWSIWVSEPCWCPPTDVYETATGIFVTAEVAGIDPDELDVTLYDDAVVVEGQRQLRPAEEEGVYHAAEVRQGAFRLEVVLPAEVDPEQVDAHYEHGLLRMTFVKTNGR